MSVVVGGLAAHASLRSLFIPGLFYRRRALVEEAAGHCDIPDTNNFGNSVWEEFFIKKEFDCCLVESEVESTILDA